MLGMLAALAALAIFHGWRTPDSVVGRALNGLAATVAGRLAQVRPQTAACFLVFVGALAALVAVGEMEGLRLAAMAAPEGLAWFVAIDVGTAVEAMALAWLAASAGGLRAAASMLRFVPRAIERLAVRRARRRRVSRPRRPAPDADDDGERWNSGGLVLAA